MAYAQLLKITHGNVLWGLIDDASQRQMDMIRQQSDTGNPMIVFCSSTFNHRALFVEHLPSNIHPALVVHHDQMQAIPVLTMGLMTVARILSAPS